ncbi:MAG: hypothetical protein ACI4DW_11270 [Lachnospiraceae bacterium]
MRKIISSLVIILSVGILCACSKKPEPEELINSFKEISTDGYVSFAADINYHVKMEDGTKTGSDVESNIEFSDQIAHFEDCTMKVEMSGVKVELKFNYWIDEDVRYLRAQMADNDSGWIIMDMENDDIVQLKEVLFDFSSDLFDDLALKETEKNENYIVTGTIAGKDFYDLYGENFVNSNTVQNITGISEDVFEDLVLDAELEFDYETNQIVSMSFVVNEEESELPNDIEEIEYELSIVFHKIDPENDEELEIPEDVIDEAVPESENNSIFSFNDPGVSEETSEFVMPDNIIEMVQSNLLNYDPNFDITLSDETDAEVLTGIYETSGYIYSLTVMYCDSEESAIRYYDEAYDVMEEYSGNYNDTIINTSNGTTGIINTVFVSEEADFATLVSQLQELMILCVVEDKNGNAGAEDMMYEINAMMAISGLD